MSQIVRSEGPLVSTFYTYGLTQLFFLALSVRGLPRLAAATLQHNGLVLTINVLTLANTLLVYVILKEISAFTYVIVFFGTLSATTEILNRVLFRPAASIWANSIWTEILIATAAIIAGWMSLPDNTVESLTALCLAVIASFAGSAYLVVSHRLQTLSGLTVIDLVASRFTLTVVICLVMLVGLQRPISVNLDALTTFALIAAVGSIIPLYLLQKSAEVIGPEKTGRFMPFIPPACGALSLIFVPNMISFQIAILALPVFVAMLSRTFVKEKAGQT